MRTEKLCGLLQIGWIQANWTEWHIYLELFQLSCLGIQAVAGFGQVKVVSCETELPYCPNPN